MSSILLVQETRSCGNEPIELLEDIVASGGPREADYRPLVDALDRLHAADFVIRDGRSVRRSENPRLLRLIDDNPVIFKTTASMQGFARCKPHGYAGDFEMIERIYNHTISNQSEVIRWDSFFHVGAAPWAVRNRASVLRALVRQTNPRSILSVGCGPGLDIIGAAGACPTLQAVTLLDNDGSAIQRATVNTRQLSAGGLALTYIVKNALRFRPEASYDFIWSSGLFDYLNDKTAAFLLRRLKDMLSPGGTIAVGNFGMENPSRSYMEIVGEWFLIHRSPADLVRLAEAAGFKEEELRVEADATGLNLFLIATNGSN